MFVVLTDISADETLGLHDDGLDQLVLPFRSHLRPESIHFSKDVTVDVQSRNLEGGPFFSCSFPTYDIDVEVCELSI